MSQSAKSSSISAIERMQLMASQRWKLVCLLVCVVLCDGYSLAAASPRYLSVGLHELNAQVDCPPQSSNDGGNKLMIRPYSCGCPPLCEQTRRGGGVRGRDRARLTALLQRSPYPRPADALAPAPAPFVTIPDRSGASLDSLEFVVVVGFGTPAQTSTVVFDTGSDLSWVQCLPCSGHCHPQHDSLFDPAKSSTYAAVPCDQPLCSAAGGKCDANGTTCLYSVKYNGGTWSTSGVLSQETLTLTSSRELSNFPFGCGQQNLGEFGAVDGLLGLGRGQLSLASHAAPSLGGTFSYCLPSYKSTPGYLSIGSTPPTSVTGKLQQTAMIKKPAYPSLYFVELISIDIGGYVLPVPPSVFTSAGTLLDSGTILTYLPGEAYAALRDRFKFTMQGSKPALPPANDDLDTCYDFAGQGAIVIPAVSLKFSDGAVFELNFFGIMTFPEPTIGCLAFAAKPAKMPFSIVGNTQQRSAEVIYDVAGEKIGFVPFSC